jgi:hypothetical protein
LGLFLVLHPDAFYDLIRAHVCALWKISPHAIHAYGKGCGWRKGRNGRRRRNGRRMKRNEWRMRSDERRKRRNGWREFGGRY